jgi:hypothetical protein
MKDNTPCELINCELFSPSFSCMREQKCSVSQAYERDPFWELNFLRNEEEKNNQEQE